MFRIRVGLKPGLMQHLIVKTELWTLQNCVTQPGFCFYKYYDPKNKALKKVRGKEWIHVFLNLNTQLRKTKKTNKLMFTF